jgi:Skp family chaperone for outer membrane proteins
LEIPYVNQIRHVARRLSCIAMLGGLLTVGLMVTPSLAQTTQTQPAQPAQPASPPPIPAGQIPIIIGILDSGKVGNMSTAGKSLNDQVNAALNGIESNFRKNEQALQAQMQQLVAARNANPAMPDFEAKRKDLYDKDAKLQQAYDKDKQALGARVEKARAKIAEAAQKIMQDIAKQKNLTLVLERTAAHAFVPQWDITNDVMARLNKVLPNVKL